ncbi:MAG: tetratricopeptide repeat protein, partial [Actinomycetia bacterium]|nr:tetratricopeptide repeat protein [Actinomycetes bacterium]
KKRDGLFKKLQEAVESNKATEEDFVQLGFAHVGMAEYDEAIEQFDKALEKKKEYDIAYYGLGYANEKKGNKEEAKKFYEKALEVSDEMIAAKEGLVRIELGLEEEELVPRIKE